MNDPVGYHRADTVIITCQSRTLIFFYQHTQTHLSTLSGCVYVRKAPMHCKGAKPLPYFQTDVQSFYTDFLHLTLFTFEQRLVLSLQGDSLQTPYCARLEASSKFNQAAFSNGLKHNGQ